MAPDGDFALIAQAPDKLPLFERWKLVQSDSVEWLRTLPADSIDICITDPAYESLEKHRAKGTTTRLKVSDGSSNQWFPVVPNSYFVPFFSELYRVMKRNTHTYVFCDAETMFAIKPMGEAAGFKFWKPIVWDYATIGMGYHYRSRHQFILFFEKGKRRLADLGMPDVLNVKRVRNGYPTQKPVELLSKLVGQSSLPGDVVVDPFFGSGSTGVAAIAAGRRFIGCDVADAAVSLAKERLRSHGCLPEMAK